MLKKILIVFALLIIIFIISASAYLFFLDRVKENNFTQLLGSEIQICGEKYDSSSKEYLALKQWLSANQRGWQNFYITMPDARPQITTNGELSLIIGDDWVIARDDKGVYSTNAQTEQIKTECE